jgi:hypothetical protein
MAKINNKVEGITVQCVGCKKKTVIPFARAAQLDGPPVCQNCLLPMVALEAKGRS